MKTAILTLTLAAWTVVMYAQDSNPPPADRPAAGGQNDQALTADQKAQVKAILSKHSVVLPDGQGCSCDQRRVPGRRAAKRRSLAGCHAGCGLRA